MPDLTIEVGTQDRASEKFRAIGRASSDMGKQLEEASGRSRRGTESMAASFFKAQVAFEAASRAGQAMFEFLRGGLRELAAAEKADRQLSAALQQLGYDAAKLTPALKAQADAFEESALVEAEAVQQIQQLLLRHAVAPRDIGKTTQAILDYSAATGKDANAATTAFIKGLQGSGEELSALGVTVQRTGDQGRDLDAVVEQLTARFGGSAAAATKGLSGDMKRLEQAQTKLSEAFATFITKSGVADTVISGLTEALKGATDALGGGPIERAERKLELNKQIIEGEKKIAELQVQREERAGAGKDTRRLEAEISERFKLVQARRLELHQINETIKAEVRNDLAAQTAIQSQGASEQAVAISQGTRKIGDALSFRSKRLEEEGKKLFAQVAQGALTLNADALQRDAEQLQKELDAEIDQMVADYRAKKEQVQKDLSKHTSVAVQKGADDATVQGQAAMHDAGSAIGMAFISGLDQQLNEMQSGGEFDVGMLVASILPAAIGAVMLLNPTTAPFAPLVMGAATVMTKAMFRKPGGQAQRTKNPYKKHDGGWAGEPRRYHAGGWPAMAGDEVPTILQEGERVLSRREVREMGGPAAVDAAARGGNQPVALIQTLDSLSFRDYAAGRGGTQLYRIQREGKGDFAAYLRRLTKGRR